MSRAREFTRRRFLQFAFGGLGAISLGRRNKQHSSSPAGQREDRVRVPTRPLGKTGFKVGIVGLGGQATLEDPARREEAVGIIHRALDLGVNYIDTASLYGHGASELAIGEVVKTRRKEVFLATKTDDRSYDGSLRQLEESLRRLHTDHVDLWQIHNIQSDFDVDLMLSREGAVKAMERAKGEGVIRFTGVTGHKDPFVLRKAIERHPFDTILMALNAADRHERSFIEHLLPTAVELQMGIMAMKVPSRGRLFRNGGIASMEPALRYVLTLPVSTAIIGISALKELDENLRIAAQFEPCTPEEMTELERSTQPYFADALWYRDHM